MLIALIIHFLASRNAQALPIRADQAIDQSAALCSDIHNCRTIWNIIWSCLVTIFGCTWVAVHPNIPDVEGKWFTAGLRRLKLMAIALVAPEMVILWALRQWLAARKLAKKYKSVFIFKVANVLMFTILRTPMDTDSWLFYYHGRLQVF